MKSLPGKVARFLKCDDGPTAIEYAFLLILIIVVCLTAITLFGEKTGDSLEHSGSEIENAISFRSGDPGSSDLGVGALARGIACPPDQVARSSTSPFA